MVRRATEHRESCSSIYNALRQIWRVIESVGYRFVLNLSVNGPLPDNRLCLGRPRFTAAHIRPTDRLGVDIRHVLCVEFKTEDIRANESNQSKIRGGFFPDILEKNFKALIEPYFRVAIPLYSSDRNISTVRSASSSRGLF